MFTGIIEEVGKITSIRQMQESFQIGIRANKVLEDCSEGDSISVNGACLTVVALFPNIFVVDIMAETLRRTTLRTAKVGDPVNLERSLRLSDRLGGHIVLGHVDGIGKIDSIRQEGIATVMTVKVPEDLSKYIAVKGSICVDGVSLTVTDITANRFEVSLIPFTKENTTLGLKKIGDEVNIEVDILSRYVERLLNYQNGNPQLTEDFLREHGFAK